MYASIDENRMVAARIDAYGGPDDVTIVEAPVPTPAEGELLVEVKAAAVNFSDLLVMSNEYQVSATPPFTPGAEFAGVVAGVGPGVDGFTVGDRVAGSAFVGAFAKYVAAQTGRVRHLPAELDWVAGAAYNASGTTAYHSLVTVGGLKAGDRVVVLGAAGGVGSACVGMAAMLGAHPIAVVSSNAKADLARGQGAEFVVNYRETDLREALRELAPGGVDLVIDPVGGSTAIPALRGLRRGGTFVVVGFASGQIPQVPLNLVLVKGLRVEGVDVRSLREQQPEVVAAGNREIGELIRRGWRPAIDSVFGIADVTAAMHKVAEGRAIGKVVVTLD